MSVIKYGQSLVQGPRQSTFEPFVGGNTTVNYTGNQSDIIGLAVQMQQSGFKTAIQEGPQWTLTVTLPYDQLTDPYWTQDVEPAPVWETSAHDAEQSILECTDRPLVASLSTNSKALLEYAIKNPLKADQVLTVDALGADFLNTMALYNLMRTGVDSRLSETMALRRTITVNNQFNCGWSLANNFKVWSRVALINYYNIPPATQVLLPDSDAVIQTDVNGITTFTGYLEKRPSTQTVSAYKVQISQEWIYGKWSAGNTGLYDVIA